MNAIHAHPDEILAVGDTAAGATWPPGINGIMKHNGYDVETVYSGETVSALLEDSEELIGESTHG